MVFSPKHSAPVHQKAQMQEQFSRMKQVMRQTNQPSTPLKVKAPSISISEMDNSLQVDESIQSRAYFSKQNSRIPPVLNEQGSSQGDFGCTSESFNQSCLAKGGRQIISAASP